MTYELAKELKDVGFPFTWTCFSSAHVPTELGDEFCSKCLMPTLSELIEACGEKFGKLIYDTDWFAYDQERTLNVAGTTPHIAVARLWLALNKKV